MWSLLGNPSRPPPPRAREVPPVLLRLTNLLGYLFLILVNVLSSTGALGGTNAEVSAKFPTPLTPSGWAFAIWGVIFALEGLGVIYGIVNSGYREGGWKASVVIKIGYGWQVGWLFQDLWQFAFVRENVVGMWLAAAALVGALAAFQLTLHRLNGTTFELRARGYAAMPAAAYVFYKLPTAVNAAWLSVATALGILIVPVSYGVSQAQLVAPAAVLAVAVTAGGVWRLLWHRDAAYGLTLIWALSAVASNDSGKVPEAVKVVGIVCAVALALCVVSALVRTRREHSTAAAAAAAAAAGGAGGGMLSDPFSPYGLYGDQRILLSDPDAPAGFQRTSSGSFSFPALPQPSAGGGGAGLGGAHSSRRAASSEGVAVMVALGSSGGGGGSSGSGSRKAQHALGGGGGSGGLGLGGGEGVAYRISAGGGGGGGSGGTGVNGVGSGAVLPAGGSRQMGLVSGGELAAAREGGEPAAGAGRRVRFHDEEAAAGMQ